MANKTDRTDITPNISININYPKNVLDYKINSIRAITSFINYVIKYKLDAKSDLARKFHSIITQDFDEKTWEECHKKVDNVNIMRGNTFYPLTFKFKDGDAHLVQLKINDCIAIAQKLMDTAEEKGFLAGYKGRNFSELIGALDSFLYMIDLFRNELICIGNDETHLIKTYITIIVNASKLTSLDDKLSEDIEPYQVFEKTLAELELNDQTRIIQKFLLEYFDPIWVKNMDDEKLEEILGLILKENEFDVTVLPTMLIELFLRMKNEKRTQYMKYLATHLTGRELDILIEASRE